MPTPETLAANSILKRGVRYSIPAPRFLKFFGIKNRNITISQLFPGTELRVAALLDECGLTAIDPENADNVGEIMLKHYNDILKVVAISTINRKAISRVALYFRMRLLRGISIFRLFELYVRIHQYSGTSPFMSITTLALQTRTTKPRVGQD